MTKKAQNPLAKSQTTRKNKMVGVATRTNPLLKKGEYMMTPLSLKGYEGAQHIRGHELLNVNGISTLTLGALLMNVFINPLAFHGTRLAGQAKLFEKYIFRRLVFHFEGSNSSSTSGLLLMSYDRDISDETPSQDIDGLRELAANASSCFFKPWEEGLMDCKLSDTQDFYYTNDDSQAERFAYQGQFYLNVAADLSSACKGALWVEYDIDLFDPSFEIENDSIDLTANSSTQTTTVDAGLDGLTLTSVSGSDFKFKTDSSGHKYIEVPSGAIYYLSCFATGCSAAGMGLAAPDVHIPNADRVGNATVNQLENVKSVGTASTGFGSLYQIIVPPLAGLAAIYLTMAAAGTTTGYGVRCFSAGGS
jgi:hypothetical protein